MPYTSLVDFRNQKNFTQHEMAKELGVSLSAYSKVEVGIRTPSYCFIKRIKLRFSEFDANIFFMQDHTFCVVDKFIP